MRNSMFLTMICVAAAAPSYAQTDICSGLLSQGIRDTQSTQISESRYNEIKSNICNSSYDSYTKAASKANSGGFDVPGAFGINASNANASSEYNLKWSNLCSSSYGLAMSNSELRSYISVANQNVLHSFDHCIDLQIERFIRYVQPLDGGKTFAVVFNNKRQGNATFKIEKLTIVNIATGMPLDLQRDCDFEHALPFDTSPYNAINIVCRKPAADSVVVSGLTSAGNIDPVVLSSNIAAPPGLADRVSALEGASESTFRLSKLASGRGDVVMSVLDLNHFLESHHNDGSVWMLCNGQNGTVDLRGRYPRGYDATLTPEGLGRTQEDQLKSHHHTTQGRYLDAQSGHGFKGSGFKSNSGGRDGSYEGNFASSDEGASETRPKTTIVNFYCRAM